MGEFALLSNSIAVKVSLVPHCEDRAWLFWVFFCVVNFVQATALKLLDQAGASDSAKLPHSMPVVSQPLSSWSCSLCIFSKIDCGQIASSTVGFKTMVGLKD